MLDNYRVTFNISFVAYFVETIFFFDKMTFELFGRGVTTFFQPVGNFSSIINQ